MFFFLATLAQRLRKSIATVNPVTSVCFQQKFEGSFHTKFFDYVEPTCVVNSSHFVFQGVDKLRHQGVFI